MNAYIYILQFSDIGHYYIGSTVDIDKRLYQHQHGHTHSTKRLGKSFKLVLLQEVDNLQIARRAESKIKSWKRRDFIEKIIKDGKISVIMGG